METKKPSLYGVLAFTLAAASVTITLGYVGDRKLALEQEIKSLQLQREEASNRRGQEINDCVEGVVEIGLKSLRTDRSLQYPSQPLCKVPDLAYWRLCDAHLSSITEIDGAYRTGKVPAKPDYAAKETLEQAARLGRKTREQAERVCSGHPVQ